ncbi:MAG: glutamate-5-semialdehyde dehydrogenase [Bacillota bacterium]|uniref:Gamma-glutamyl phosphate reductase n=1 Tax=Virgibacillus salarius TaxID=447199 RepID=A0A941I8M5_9BACI|nr:MULTISPECIES: glutamate-5-semialdehyde dehydrogenase [Bacillaceae]MBR7794598.1 glutamate-5-semialdehyde dehydrogenase [Virgibacillus salarius]MCC2252181.1 glutamate-5-semialdehyde dehydrogenase [Virgibacillus sp. AGTR]NAZ07320.1 glutamate-5-semialdehyde dehydrogenase [Agaribacter marinus]QRZ16341.1 glutamate-5-semialdehyde dehydrogenase [Virgibacillus sp. AGTR]
MEEIQTKGKLAKRASFQLNAVSTDDKNKALECIAKQILMEEDLILKENRKDLQEGENKGLTASILDRIMLNSDRLQAMHDAIIQLIQIADPIGEVLESIDKENGLRISRKRVPIGVIGMIYEARPNVTIDAATLALKTGNAVILRGSSSAKHSNQALVSVIHRALANSRLPIDSVQLIENTSRESAKELFTLNSYLDVLIPRGGKNLIDTVIRESTVPVIETGAGNCHLFIDESADFQMAQDIVLNAKLQRPSVCNAMESLLIQERWFENYGGQLLEQLHKNDVDVIGDKQVCSKFSFAKPATEKDWQTEYLDLAVSVKIVKSCEEAIHHINLYGTKHSEGIITENVEHAALFQQQVDAAAVYHNASTRFTDGFEFGYGAEIGISTQKLHARGPMGLPALTSSKFFIQGNGQIRS